MLVRACHTPLPFPGVLSLSVLFWKCSGIVPSELGPTWNTGPSGAWPLRPGSCCNQISLERRSFSRTETSCYQLTDNAHLIPACTPPATQHSLPVRPPLHGWGAALRKLLLTSSSNLPTVPPMGVLAVSAGG